MKKRSVGLTVVSLIYVCMFLLLSGRPVQAVYDAQFVRCVIPETLTTDEIFPATICMRNTGDTAWPSGDMTILMCSQNPANNYTWGSYFILIKHSAYLVTPGDTLNYTSNLRAPSTPGKYAFAWQCYDNIAKQFFGEIVPAESIYVQQRLETPPPPPPHKDSLLDSSDFEYIGSFKLPTITGYEDVYVASGLALRTMPDSTKRFFLNTGTYTHCLYEVEMPQLVKIENNDYSGLNTAPLVKQWATIAWDSAVSGENITSNGGFWWDDSANILYWTHYNSYYAGGGFPMLAATRLANDSVTNLKYWYLPMPRLPVWKAYWRGVTSIPKTFADAYTGGRTMALGFGGYFSICQPASSGPAIAAIQKPDMFQDTLDLVEVLRYIYPEAANRNGNYFGANTSIWGYQPPSPWDGKFTYGSSCAAGVFIDLPDKKGYVAFVKHNIVRIGYDWGGLINDAHYEDNWYFYDFKDLGEAALGNRALGSVQPSSFVKINWPYPVSNTATYHSTSGACFDPQTRIMYVYVTRALGTKPAIHAYHVTESPARMETVLPEQTTGSLISIHPNPFNPTAKIILNAALDVKGLDKADIMVFNVHGKLVQRLAATGCQLAAGLDWDASLLPSGIYMLQVKIGQYLLRGRVSVIK